MIHELDTDQPLHLRLDIVAFRDRPPEQANVCLFAGQGGSIGRTDENDCVLPDTENVVSRTHALISYENGDYFLADQSTNGTFVNDSLSRLEPGERYRINDGDRLLLGSYLVAASLVPANTPLSAAASLHPEMTQSPFLSELDSGASVDTTEDSGALPEMDGWPSDSKRPSWFPADEENELEIRGNAPLERDPFAERPPVPALQQHLAQPVSSHFGAEESEAGRPEREQVKSRIAGGGVPTGYIPGSAQFEALAGEGLIPGGSSGQEEPYAPSSPERSIAAERSPADEPYERVPDVSAAAESISGAAPEPAPKTNPTDPRISAGQTIPPVSGKVDMELLAALLNGLGSPALQVAPEKATEFMTKVGQLTHEAIQGMIDTLRLRDEFKREFYVPVTRIAPTENNVFKHSANVDDALARAFSETASSAYLGPAESTRQAFQDIAAHQLALVAGMQAAVTFLLERFSPQALEERIGKASVLDGVLPSVHKAHMWEQFEQEYAKIAEQAEEDFQRVFGQHFERAYTQQIHKLHSAGFGGHKESDS